MRDQRAVKIGAEQSDSPRHRINLGIDFRHAMRRLEARLPLATKIDNEIRLRTSHGTAGKGVTVHLA
jgi:hypothetical protein